MYYILTTIGVNNMQMQFVVQYLCDDYEYAKSMATPAQIKKDEVEFVTLSRHATRELATKSYALYRRVFKANLFRITIEEIDDDKRKKRC
tara:strand:- start:55 stop:324 length:270 start_codon:yes stop_codon:yes gene_type:complete